MKQFIKLPIMVAEKEDVEEFELAVQEELRLRELIDKDEDEELDIELARSERMVYISMSKVDMFDEADDEKQTLLLVGEIDFIVNLPINEFIKVLEENGY